MSDIDISPEAVEKLAQGLISRGISYYADKHIAATLRALASAVKANRERDLRLIEHAAGEARGRVHYMEDYDDIVAEDVLTAFEAQEKERK